MPPKRARTAAEWKTLATSWYAAGELAESEGRNLDAVECFSRAQAAASIGLLVRTK